MTAQDKRFEALKTVSTAVLTQEKFLTDDGYTSVRNVWLIKDRSEIASMIRGLAKLGRTERWQSQVEGWACMVENEENLEWAWLQGSVWVSHAA